LGVTFGRIITNIEHFLSKIDIGLRQFIQSVDQFKELEILHLSGAELPTAHHLCQAQPKIILRAVLLIWRAMITPLILRTVAVVVSGAIFPSQRALLRVVSRGR
jgi:hypothetical protein